MATIEVFDPAMCCSTGVCGPSVDPALSTFAANLGWIEKQGVTVARHNLSQEPGAFAESPIIRQLLTNQGDEALPAVVVAGELAAWGRYPTREELISWALRSLTDQKIGDTDAAFADETAMAEAPACCSDAVMVGDASASEGSGCCG